MDSHAKKMIAPVIITCLLAVYMLVYLIIIVSQPMRPAVKILIGAIPLALLCASVYVLIERIKEIRSGEEDDLGKY